MRILIVSGVLGIVGLGANSLLAQDVVVQSPSDVTASGCGCDQGCDSCGCSDVSGACCEGCKDKCGHCRSRCRRCRALGWRHITATTQFNCCCRGSYKFPVLPQYTYHWPGMFSAQTMTEYVSPYRFPLLTPLEEMQWNEVPAPMPPQPVSSVLQTSYHSEEPVADGTSASAIMKRHYGLP